MYLEDYIMEKPEELNNHLYFLAEVNVIISFAAF